MIYPILAISTDGIQFIRDSWESFTPKQKEVLQDIREQSLRFKTMNYQGKTWKILAGAFRKPSHLQRLVDFLGSDIIVWRCWLKDGRNYHRAYDENGDGIGNPVFDNPKNWAQAIAEERLDENGNPIPFTDNQDALDSMPVIFGQRKRVA